MQKAILRLLFFLGFQLIILMCHAQGSLTFDIKKPQKFENRKLGSEKTGEKKFTLPRRFIQNTVTHYNWYFNAKTRLNDVIERAKLAHIDNYSTLLPFYNYSLEDTRREKSELDSVIYKTTAGILIHDLRNDWIDNLYLLMGKAYYYMQELDSAYLTFQYINYAFAPKESDGYDIPIGSNVTEGGNVFSISTKEKRSFPKKIISEPPSRNESLVWQIRTYIASDEMAEAAGLIETLRLDPHFPERLHTELYELQAWWFYKQEVLDSAAFYLEKALPNAENKQEVARWEYLIAQLHEKTGNSNVAETFYKRAINHTLNPVLEVYARLNAIRQHKEDSVAVQKSVEELLKMARKDRYTNYRDIIYYTAAQIELERNNRAAAKQWLIRATASTNNFNTAATGNLRTKAFLQLGDLAYEEKNYPEAKRFYDSVDNTTEGIPEPLFFETKRTLLTEIREQLEIISRQDSLQRIAGMPDVEREAFIRKMLRQLRKTQGLKEEEGPDPRLVNSNRNEPPADLFGNNVKGEWYFNNPSLKSKGYSDFRNKWGNRPNVDNWRRMSAVTTSNQPDGLNQDDMALKPPILSTELTYESLLDKVPLQPQQLAASNDSIEAATAALGKLYMEGLEDYSSAIQVLSTFIEKFPYSYRQPEVLFQLYYSYLKSGNEQKAKEIAALIKQKYPDSRANQLIAQRESGDNKAAVSDMQRRYDLIYNQFIEGSFGQAMEEKRIADSLYSSNYWTAQLLYVQAIYQVRQGQDDSAGVTLRELTAMFPESPLHGKALTMLDVLSRRQEIEEYLTNLVIERPSDTSATDTVAIIPAPQIRKADSTVVKTNPVVVSEPPVQTSVQTPVQTPVPPPVISGPPPVQPPAKTGDSLQQTKPITIVAKPPVNNVPAQPNYTFTPDALHLVILVLDKVDPVYVSESRNAFNRYNREKYYNRTIDISNQAIDDNVKLVVMGNFESAAVALDYMEKTRKAAPTEIVPWLPAGKYSFFIITAHNLEVLKAGKDVSIYKAFLSQHYPGKF